MDAGDTREKLLDAATRLFAERGIHNVSLAEIVREAGQRNASAVHYHFGNRDEILRAVLERYVPVIRERRLELLDRAATTAPDDARAVVEAIVRPVTEFAQRGWRERGYLQIGSELSNSLDRTTPEIRALLRETAGQDAMALLLERVPALPADIWAERAGIIHPFIGRAAADRARRLDRGADADGDPNAGTDEAEGVVLSDDRFVDNLVDMVLGAVTSPATESPRPPGGG